MNVLDLFSGIGGFSLGLERAGFKTVAFCEIESFPRKVLKKHWPAFKCYEDVKNVTKKRLASDGIIRRGQKIDVICGGFPCQPFSVAGQQKSKQDDRHLWPEMFRIIREVKPTFVIGENVAGIVRLALDDVLLDLENEGYTTQSFIIPACAVGATHRRDRVWFVAYTTIKGLQRSAKKTIQKFAPLQGELVRSGEVLGVVPNKHKPAILGTCNGFPGRMDRVKALGNAVVPQIPEIIGRAIYGMA